MTDTKPKEPLVFSNFVSWLKSTVQGANTRREAQSPDEETSSRSAQSRSDTIISAMLEAYPGACFVIDRHGAVKYSNSSADSQFGRIRFGYPISFSLRSPKFLEAFQRVCSRRIAERISWDEKNVTDVSLEAFISPIASLGQIDSHSRKTPELFLVSVQDFSEHKRLEKMRVDFVANASHELRTPLASLMGYMETLQGPAKSDDQAREKFLAIMLEQARRMGRLIDDLLSLSRIEIKSLVDSEITADLVLCINHVIDSLTPLANELSVEVEFNPSYEKAMVNGEFDELVQVVENLIGNALRYGTDGERVIVSVSKDEYGSAEPCWNISVKDFGPGIESVHVPRLTERFYRVDVETSREMKGTGLGLSIVKHILNRHRARLTIESEPGQGALFTVHIPTAKNQRQQ